MITHEVVAPLLRTGEAGIGGARFIDVRLTLDRPTDRIAIHAPGLALGRADALLSAHRVWASKHHWTETRGDDAVTTYEFDEALPAGPCVLRIPV
jgi:hypothetical protein